MDSSRTHLETGLMTVFWPIWILATQTWPSCSRNVFVFTGASLNVAWVRECRPFFFLIANGGQNAGNSARRSKRKAWKQRMSLFFVNNSHRMQCFHWESFVFTCLTYTMSSIFQTGRSTNSMVWNLAKWAKFSRITRCWKNQECSWTEFQRRYTTTNCIVRILNEATSVVNYTVISKLISCVILVCFFYLFSLCSILLQ